MAFWFFFFFKKKKKLAVWHCLLCEIFLLFLFLGLSQLLKKRRGCFRSSVECDNLGSLVALWLLLVESKPF
jgi:hypothetical protein